MYVSQITPSDEIHHHGVMGMKWGTRRSYNRSITKAGKHVRKSASNAVKAYRHDEKLNTLKNMPGASSNKKVQKLQRKLDKEEKASTRHAEAARAYISEAAKTGVRSYTTDNKDIAKLAIRAMVDPVFVGHYQRKLESQNFAANMANEEQDASRKK